MIKDVILAISVILLTGLLFTKIAKALHFPNVTGYLVGGLLIGPSVLGLVDKTMLNGLNILCDVALGFIALTIGFNFKVSYFKKVGAKPFIIALFESLMASVLVFCAVMLFALIAGKDKLGNQPVVFALLLASIASATAPAATLLVIKQYKAKGEVTDNLLSVVAIDDAVALAIFGFSMTFALRIFNHTSGGNLALSIAMPFIEIILSLVIGVVLGIGLVLLIHFFKGRSNRICCVIAICFAGIGIDSVINSAFDMNLSTLLTCMMIGAVMVNLSNYAMDVMPLIDRFTPALYMLFFVVSGADLELKSVASIGLIGIIYVVVRVVGKYVGAIIGSVISKAGKNTTKYLGWCLIPQAGVALGLSGLVATRFVGSPIGSQIRTIILCATLIYELIGPLVVKITLTRANEIQTVKPEIETPTVVEN